MFLYHKNGTIINKGLYNSDDCDGEKALAFFREKHGNDVEKIKLDDAEIENNMEVNELDVDGNPVYTEIPEVTEQKTELSQVQAMATKLKNKTATLAELNTVCLYLAKKLYKLSQE